MIKDRIRVYKICLNGNCCITEHKDEVISTLEESEDEFNISSYMMDLDKYFKTEEFKGF